MIRRFFLLLALALLPAGVANAQSAQPADSALEIHRGLNVSTVRPLRVQLEPEGSALGLSAVELENGPALVEVIGDANRVYRIQILGGDATEVSFEIWSNNAGDITASRVAVMDAAGRDLLRISGDPEALRRLFGETGKAPLNIQYE